MLTRLLLVFFIPLSLWATEFLQCKHLLNRTSFGIDQMHLQTCLKSDSYHSFLHTLIYQDRREFKRAEKNYHPRLLRPSRKMRELNSKERKAFRKKRRESYMHLKEYWFKQMLTTEDPFKEKMILFWHNHFTSSLKKVGQASLLYKQHILLEKHALGNFAELLHAIIEDPAMLSYLDNRGNRKGHPNENLARELLELFTMGEGNYKEKDIQALARTLTGYSLNRNLHFKFKRNIHDKSTKVFLGQKGHFDAHDIVEIILAQPATSKFMVKKLWLTFIDNQAEPKEVERLAQLFKIGNYEMKPLLEALFTSKYFTTSSNYGTMVKSPVDLIVGTLRSFDYRDFDAKMGIQYSRRLGQDLFDPPNVKGWSGGETWVNTHTLLLRKAFLNRFLRGENMKHLHYGLFNTCPVPENQREICAAKTLLPVNIFMTPAPTFKQSLRTIFQHPLYQLK